MVITILQSISPPFMRHPSINEFRETIKIIDNREIYADGRIFSYWNNGLDAGSLDSLDELLHIKEREGNLFVLEVGNIAQEGTLPELEKELYKWAADEGWFDA